MSRASRTAETSLSRLVSLASIARSRSAAPCAASSVRANWLRRERTSSSASCLAAVSKALLSCKTRSSDFMWSCNALCSLTVCSASASLFCSARGHLSAATSRRINSATCLSTTGLFSLTASTARRSCMALPPSMTISSRSASICSANCMASSRTACAAGSLVVPPVASVASSSLIRSALALASWHVISTLSSSSLIFESLVRPSWTIDSNSRILCARSTAARRVAATRDSNSAILVLWAR
mmetsp:Transcript_127201/g.407032  ORF Transcript_127201/g.407032 Transcript_127201/m.407032 type:complete len:241 (+) Transcript_127201:1211-1933(+)